ncbi:MAG: methylmalonyl-CoA epimerase [Candidatus Limnocylindria bacterium]
MTARELHHVGVVVPSIEAALPFYRDTLGLVPGPTLDLEEQAVRVVFLTGGSGRVELLEPTDGSSGVARFLAERGHPTLHHVCFAVDDLAAVLRDLEALGVELVDRVPRRGAEGDVAFLHPRAADGVLVELIDRASLHEGRP